MTYRKVLAILFTILMSNSFVACEFSEEPVETTPQMEEPTVSDRQTRDTDTPTPEPTDVATATEEVPDGIDNDLDG